jgi:hypothetical protein
MGISVNCPKCRSGNVVFSKKRRVNIRGNCGYEFAREKPTAQLVESDKPDHRNARRVLRSLALQLATRFPDYRKLLLTLFEIAELGRKDAAKALGAVGLNLAALGCFFASSWHKPVSTLPVPVQARLLSEVGYHLRACVGRNCAGSGIVEPVK